MILKLFCFKLFLFILYFFFGSTNEQETDYIDTANLLEVLPFDNKHGGLWTQGWDVNYDESEWSAENPLKVFVIPFSHNDPGWLQTYVGYFESSTHGIIDSVVSALLEDKSRKFVWSEISYLDLWWKASTDQQRNQMRQLISEGQLEIVTGGWVMNDEAAVHYTSTIIQLTEGHEWLKNHGIEEKPKHTWSIDPFGHSVTQPHLYSLAQFNTSFIQRIHYALKKDLSEKKSLQFRWRQRWDTDGENEMFTEAGPFFSYDIPHSCGPEPKYCGQFQFHLGSTAWGDSVVKINPSESKTSPQLKIKADSLVPQLKKKAQLYRTNTIIYPYGDDFLYKPSQALDLFNNHKYVQDYINSNLDKYHVDIKFATLDEYRNQLLSEKSINEYPVLNGDFHTYADKEKEYWSGYFTTRPFHKNFARQGESLLRAADILYAIGHQKMVELNSELEWEELFPEIRTARQTVSLYQHHDGITGTSKSAVASDYHEMFLRSEIHAKIVIKKMTGAILNQGNYKNINYFENNLNSFISKDSTLIFYNPTQFEISEIKCIKVKSLNFQIFDFKNLKIKFQYNPILITDNLSKKLDFEDEIFEICFNVYMSPLGFSTYKIEQIPDSSKKEENDFSKILKNWESDCDLDIFKCFSFSKNEDYFLENDNLKVNFNNEGLISNIYDKRNFAETEINEKFETYSTQKGGAYLFLPIGNSKKLEGNLQIVKIQGEIMDILITKIGDVIKRTVILSKLGFKQEILDFDTEVTLTKSNIDLITKFDTNLNSKNEFFTDANGFQTLKRKYRSDRPIQANYYPITSYSYIQDLETKTRLTVLVKHPLGVSSLNSGSLEFMLDRKNSQDDSRGLQESINDNKKTNLKFFLSLENLNNFENFEISNQHISSKNRVFSHILNYGSHILTYSEKLENLNQNSFSVLSKSLPETTELLLFKIRDLEKKQIMFQISKFYNSGSNIQKKNEINLNKIWSCFLIQNLEEFSLTYLYHIQYLDSNHKIEIKNNEIKSFLFNFNFQEKNSNFNCNFKKILSQTENIQIFENNNKINNYNTETKKNLDQNLIIDQNNNCNDIIEENQILQKEKNFLETKINNLEKIITEKNKEILNIKIANEKKINNISEKSSFKGMNFFYFLFLILSIILGIYSVKKRNYFRIFLILSVVLNLLLPFVFFLNSEIKH